MYMGDTFDLPASSDAISIRPQQYKQLYEMVSLNVRLFLSWTIRIVSVSRFLNGELLCF